MGFPSVGEVREDVWDGRGGSGVVHLYDDGFACGDHGAEGWPGVFGDRATGGAGGSIGFGCETGGLEGGGEGGGGLIVRVDDEDGDNVVGVGVDPGFDGGQVAFERSGVFECAATVG